MAEVDIAPHFGAELKDAFKPVNSWVAGNIAWLDDIQQFYRERSTIEKEYSAKLVGLAKKHYEKKSRKSGSLSVGDTPVMTPGSLESASLTTWTTHLSMVEARAAEHDKFASEIISHVAEPLKYVAGQFEEMRKRHAEYAAKLEQERDACYSDLGKYKGKYDGVCSELENRRKKAQSAFDHSKPKAQSAFHQQSQEMHNSKNAYLINIQVANHQKALYYHSYVPELLDSLQDLSETKTSKLNTIWTQAAKLESDILAKSGDHVNHLNKEIQRNNPLLDSMMFARHNASDWQEPADKAFEPSPLWHDDASMVTDDTAKIFLRNILSKSKASLADNKREADTKRREVANMKRLRERVRMGKEQKDEVEVVRATLHLQEQLHECERKQSTAEVEKSTITGAVGDVSVGGRNHNLKAQTFKIPTNCDLCGDRIWGLSAKGFDCKDCGYTLHSKCEMKVPADCPGEQSKEGRKKLKAERQEAANASMPDPSSSTADMADISRSNTLNSLSSGYATNPRRSVSAAGSMTEETVHEKEAEPVKPRLTKPSVGGMRKNRVVAPPPTQYVGELVGNGENARSKASKSSEPQGKMLYTYQALSEGEVDISEGTVFTIIEPDDGGWTKVRCGSDEGLIPTAYFEAVATKAERPLSTYSNSSASLAGSMTGARKKGPAVAPKRGAKKLQWVEALYVYTAQSDAEWSMQEGERFVLVSPDSGDGWAEVEKGGVSKSVPANYIQHV
ncbi:MAG: hypothetical protein M1814_002632 [Vezdaea aestivalis]|nr:MAG: hypothetical protein M1814_002632 [Vezdaea aestivalis]